MAHNVFAGFWRLAKNSWDIGWGWQEISYEVQNFLYDYAAYIRDERLADSFTSRYTYIDKTMYVLPLVDEETNLDKSEYTKALRSTKNHLDLFTDFYYMTGGIPIDVN